jgi:dTDP-4-amino-4,6-dideoxygalactose transaminase
MEIERKVFPLTHPAFDSDELRLLADCLNSGWVTQGPMVRKFERLMAEKHKTEYALAVTSCTAALHLATLALEIGPGDEVIVPAFTWVTSAHCAEYVGARAVFADVETDTFNLDPRAFEAAITPKTRAVVVVHLFGLAAKMDEIMEIARRHNLFVIEDAACAIGTTYNDQPVGSTGELGCFSFHPRKVVTTGEGGMVTTNSQDLAKKVMSLRTHGDTIFFHPQPSTANKPYIMDPFDLLGYNLRLSDIQAAVGIAQMAKLDRLLAQRKRSAERYNERLADLADLELPTLPPKCGHTYQSYVVRLNEGGVARRNLIMDFLTEQHIQTRPGTHAVHRLGYYREKYNLHPEMYPNACLGEDTTITLPIYPDMVEDDQDFIVNILREALHIAA